MKQSILIIALFTLAACGQQAGKSAAGEQAAHIDSLYIDSNNINGSGGQAYGEFNNCNFDSFVAEKNTQKVAKDIVNKVGK